MTGLHDSEDAPSGRWWIEPTAFRYIKLGPGGAWVDRCLDEGVVELGHNGVPHALARAGDWDAVRAHFIDQGLTPAKASDFTRELRDFYELPDTALWITTARGRLWWAFAEAEVRPVSEEGRGGRLRRVRGRWRSTDVEGAPLSLDSLSTRLTRVAAYRQTLCRVEAADYLVRRINARPEPVVADALAARANLLEITARMIAGLHWRDFEVLVDLIFAQGGWRRISAVGGSDQADSDLVLEQATTGERAMVQVKSSADPAVVADYTARFRAGGWDRCFFVCHTSRGRLAAPELPRFHLWQGDVLAHQAVKAGLVDWLIARCR
jgi:hypothetical protein